MRWRGGVAADCRQSLEQTTTERPREGRCTEPPRGTVCWLARLSAMQSDGSEPEPPLLRAAHQRRVNWDYRAESKRACGAADAERRRRQRLVTKHGNPRRKQQILLHKLAQSLAVRRGGEEMGQESSEELRSTAAVCHDTQLFLSDHCPTWFANVSTLPTKTSKRVQRIWENVPSGTAAFRGNGKKRSSLMRPQTYLSVKKKPLQK